MNIKSALIAAALATASVASSASVLTLESDGYGSLVASFQGDTSGSLFSFTVQAGDSLDVLSLTGTSFNTAGFHISDLKFDGVSVSSNSSISGDFSNWSYSVANLNAGEHTIQIFGIEAAGATFNGLVQITAAVPEPQTYAMLLAGLAAVGFVSRRRKSA